MTKFQIILTGSIVVAALATSLLIERRAQANLRESDAWLRQQDDRLIELAAENQRLSNLVFQTTANRGTAPEDRTAELAQLRAKVEALRWQTNHVAQQVAESRRAAGTQLFSQGDFNLLDHNDVTSITFAGGPRADGKLNDARGLAAALRKYADEHQGEFPRGLDSVAAYLPKPLETNSPPWVNAPLTGTNDFEIVYEGSQNDLSNIPPRRVALIRERQPWLTPDGKWARVYGYADGAASTVESDDNFQSWETQYIIPPPTARQ